MKNIDRLLSYVQVQKIINRSRSSIWRDIQAGQFPEPIKLPSGCVRFRETDIQRWVEDPGGWC